MLINGEKYACEACIRGHRVSSCHHQDRLLVHVNKKGRPVSQCHHCRGLRKARSQHVKCECHEKPHSKEDCPHTKSDTAAEPHTCCCGHGARCTCSLKKDHLDPVPEDMLQSLQQPKDHPKPRLTNMNSHESKATVFTNGHHKPVHKINDAHNRVGSPYKVPSRSNTVQGHREVAQKSTDSLPLPKSTAPAHESPLHHSITSAPATTRQVKSEHGSPILGPTSAPLTNPSRDMVIPPLDPNAYSYSPFDDSQIIQPANPELTLPERFPDSWFMTYDQALEYEPPLASTGLNEAPSVDWSTFNFDNNGFYDMGANNFGPSQPPSYASFDHLSHLGQPVLTSSSEEVSEVEDFHPVPRPINLRTTSQDPANDLSSPGDDAASDAYRLSSASSYRGTPQANMLADGNIENIDFNDFMQVGTDGRPAQMLNQQKLQHQLQQQQAQQMQQAFLMQMQLQQQRQQPPPAPQQVLPAQQQKRTSVVSQPFVNAQDNLTPDHPYTIHEAQAYAHMAEAMRNQPPEQAHAMASNTFAEDPMWSMPPEIVNGEVKLDDEREDEDWVR